MSIRRNWRHTMSTYTFLDQGIMSPEYETYEGVLNAIEEYAREGETEERTYYETYTIYEDGEPLESITIAIHPPVPDCGEAAEHDWQRPLEVVGGCAESPGTWGEGGRIRTVSVCMNCGMGQHYTNWNTNPENGTQGHEAYFYVEDEFIDEVKEHSDE